MFSKGNDSHHANRLPIANFVPISFCRLVMKYFQKLKLGMHAEFAIRPVIFEIMER